MDKTVKKDLIAILAQTKDMLKKGNHVGLKEISDHTIHDASIFQDEDSVSIAVVLYSLFKILQRLPDKILTSRVVRDIKECLEYLDLDDIAGYRNTVKHMLEMISDKDHKMKLYVEQVINQSGIKKGSKLYEHGISLARAAEVLGVTQWELMGYIGKKKIPELEAEKYDAAHRLEFARKIFNIK